MTPCPSSPAPVGWCRHESLAPHLGSVDTVRSPRPAAAASGQSADSWCWHSPDSEVIGPLLPCPPRVGLILSLGLVLREISFHRLSSRIGPSGTGHLAWCRRRLLRFETAKAVVDSTPASCPVSLGPGGRASAWCRRRLLRFWEPETSVRFRSAWYVGWWCSGSTQYVPSRPYSCALPIL